MFSTRAHQPRTVPFRGNWIGAALASIVVSTAAGTVSATTIEAVSFVDASHRITVNGGAVPDGITSRVSGPTFDPLDISSSIDDPDATVAVDTTNTIVGCASCDPGTPFISQRQLRTNRPDPTEFADAQYDISSLIDQDEGNDVAAFAVGVVEVDRSGLAQLRLTSTPVAAQAHSAYGLARTTTFENVTGGDISFDIAGELDAFVLSRFTGDDGFARTSTTFSILFSGLTAGNLSYDDGAGPDIIRNEIGAGASVTDGLFDTGDGVMGLQFTVGATALGDGGTTEANFDILHAFGFDITLEAGQSVDMFFGWTQVNDVEFTPPPAVPLPAGMLLLGSGLAMLTLRKRKSKPTTFHSKQGNLIC